MVKISINEARDSSNRSGIKNIMNSFRFFLFSLFFICLAYSQQGFSYERDEEYPSPNKKYIARLAITDTETVLTVKNCLTSKNDFSKSLVPCIQNIKWTPDSKSLFIVSHLSGGSMATIVHYKDERWKLYDNNPPILEPCYYFVIGVHFYKKFARLIYGIYPSKGSPFKEQKLCIFDIDWKTGSSKLISFKFPSKKDLDQLTIQEKIKWKMRENGTANTEIKKDYF